MKKFNTGNVVRLKDGFSFRCNPFHEFPKTC